MSQTSSNKSLIYWHRTATGHNVAYTSVDAGNMSMTVLAEGQTADDTARGRRDIESAMGIAPGTTRFVSQTHSTTVLDAGSVGWAQRDTVGEGDAIIAQEGTDPIAILVADCLPIAFTTDYGPTAIAHAGRVGLLNGVLQNTIDRLRNLGDGNITATIGPGICGACYEVPLQMQHDAAIGHPRIASRTSWGTPALDLPAAAEDLLTAAGVSVYRIDQCTFENERLYSHRRHPGVGRLAGFVWKDQN